MPLNFRIKAFRINNRDFLFTFEHNITVVCFKGQGFLKLFGGAAVRVCLVIPGAVYHGNTLADNEV